MSRSLWTIAIIGFITIVILVITFLFMFKRFGDSPYSKGAKISLAIRDEFHFDAVGTGTVAETQKTAFLIQYDTRADSKFNLAAQNQEMQAVAVFAVGKLEPLDRKNVDEIRVRRTEVRGSGCWQRSYVTDLTVPNPLRGAPGTLPPFPPK